MTQTNSDAILARMMALHPKIIDLTLDRVDRLLTALDNPHEKLQIGRASCRERVCYAV